MDISLKTSLIFVVSFAATFFILPHLSGVASKIGLLDHPNNRKVHVSPKPLIGGLGMMMGIALSCLLFMPLANLRGFYAGLILLSLAGFLDDYREINHRWKFVAQIIATFFMIYFSRTILHSFGDLLSFGPIIFNRASVLLTVFGTVGVINAINMIDGVDGLAGSISLTAFVSFAILAFLSNQTELFLLSIAYIGALIAFLRYNWHPSSLFMGDAGSLTLGFALTFISVAITQGKGSIIPPVAPLLILTVPITDTLTVMIKRLLKNKSPFRADKSHLHHIFLRFGLSKKDTVRVMVLLTMMFSTLAIAGTVFEMPEYYLFGIFSVYFISYFAASFYIKEMFRFLRKSGKRQKARLIYK